MFNGVPTRPVTAWNGARADVVHALQCAIPGLSGHVVVKEVNSCGLLLEVARPPRVGTQHRACLTFEDLRVNQPVHVTHVSTRYAAGAGARHYIGLGFRSYRGSDRRALDVLLGRLNRPAGVDAAA
jgi:hypothetical protein